MPRPAPRPPLSVGLLAHAYKLSPADAVVIAQLGEEVRAAIVAAAAPLIAEVRAHRRAMRVEPQMTEPPVRA